MPLCAQHRAHPRRKSATAGQTCAENTGSSQELAPHLDEAGHPDVVDNRGSSQGGSGGKGHVDARVVHLAIEVHDAPFQLRLLGVARPHAGEGREELVGGSSCHEVAPRQPGGASHQVVRLQACPIVGHLPPGVAGGQRRQWVAQVRGGHQHVLPLSQSLQHQLQLPVVQLCRHACARVSWDDERITGLCLRAPGRKLSPGSAHPRG